MIEKVDVEKAKQPEIEKLREQVAAIKVLLPDYDELSNKHSVFDKNKTDIESFSGTITTTEASIKTVESEIAALTEEGKSLEKAGEDKIKLENEKKVFT